MFRKPLGSQRASLVAQVVKDMPAVQEMWVRSLGQEDPQQYGEIPVQTRLGSWTHPRACVLLPLPPKASLHSLPPDSSLPRPQNPTEVPKRLLSQERGLIWGPQHQETWSLGYFLKLKARGSGNHPWVELGCLVAARQHRLKRGSIQDSQHGCSVPLQASHGIQGCPDSRDGRAAQVREVGGN